MRRSKKTIVILLIMCFLVLYGGIAYASPDPKYYAEFQVVEEKTWYAEVKDPNNSYFLSSAKISDDSSILSTVELAKEKKWFDIDSELSNLSFFYFTYISDDIKDYDIVRNRPYFRCDFIPVTYCFSFPTADIDLINSKMAYKQSECSYKKGGGSGYDGFTQLLQVLHGNVFSFGSFVTITNNGYEYNYELAFVPEVYYDKTFDLTGKNIESRVLLNSATEVKSYLAENDLFSCPEKRSRQTDLLYDGGTIENAHKCVEYYAVDENEEIKIGATYFRRASNNIKNPDFNNDQVFDLFVDNFENQLKTAFESNTYTIKNYNVSVWKENDPYIQRVYIK